MRFRIILHVSNKINLRYDFIYLNECGWLRNSWHTIEYGNACFKVHSVHHSDTRIWNSRLECFSNLKGSTKKLPPIYLMEFTRSVLLVRFRKFLKINLPYKRFKSYNYNLLKIKKEIRKRQFLCKITLALVSIYTHNTSSDFTVALTNLTLVEHDFFHFKPYTR